MVVIDHTSVLKTIAERWGTAPLTASRPGRRLARRCAQPVEARDDDPLAGVATPSGNLHHLNAAVPSSMERRHAAKVAALPLRNSHGHYEEARPSLGTAGELADFIRDRTAAWVAHIARQRRRGARGQPGGAPPAAPAAPRRRAPRSAKTRRPKS